MNYILTRHANKVLLEREIPIEYMEQVLCNPEWIEPDKEDFELEHRLGKILEYGNRVLRVVIDRNVEPVHIITVYFDRRMRKKCD